VIDIDKEGSKELVNKYFGKDRKDFMPNILILEDF